VLDIVFIASIVGFFIACNGFARLIDRL